MYNDRSNEIYANSDMYTLNLIDITKKITDAEWRAFRIMVSHGISEEKNAEEAIVRGIIAENGPCITKKTAWLMIKSLVKLGLYDCEKIHTGYRNFNLLRLTPLGVRLYRERFRKEPTVQEHTLLIKEHASILHGYMIKDVATILAKKGIYKYVSTSRKNNRLKTLDGSIFIPDVIGGYENGAFDCYEVECGNHNQSDFNAKCNKLRAMKRITIIGQSREKVTRLLKPQVEDWIRSVGKDFLAGLGVAVYLYSITDFAKNQVTYYYDMVSDEPMCCFKMQKTEGYANEE